MADTVKRLGNNFIEFLGYRLVNINAIQKVQKEDWEDQSGKTTDIFIVVYLYDDKINLRTTKEEFKYLYRDIKEAIAK